MPTPSAAPDFATLLEHSLWMRRLAGILTHDDARAEDLTQETWVSVLRHPPAADQPARPWLGQVVRNLARMGFRGERRRRGREEAVESAQVPDPHHDSPEQLVERVQAQRMLAELVVGLAEPFRSTILLRYYEGLSSADIAARQAVPPGTVRWRLKKGLAELRTELDRRHGSRQAWLPALAPLVAGPPQPVASIPFTTKLKGALTMNPFIPAIVMITSAIAGLVAVQPQTPAANRPTPAVTAPAAPAPARLDKPHRALLLQNIQQAQRKATPARNPAQTKTGATLVPELNPEYIRAQIQLLIPMIKECYENALLSHRFDGKLVVKFTIAAARDVGGLVTESAIDPTESTITDVPMRECVQETMYAAQFPAPSDGGEVKVTYPFVFSAGD